MEAVPSLYHAHTNTCGDKSGHNTQLMFGNEHTRVGLGHTYIAFVKDPGRMVKSCPQFVVIDLLPLTIALSFSVLQATECALNTRVYANGRGELRNVQHLMPSVNYIRHTL